MDRAQRKLAWLLIAVLAATSVWMVVETMRAGSSHYGLHRGTPAETIVITPGRALTAYHLFLVTLSLAPAVWLLRFREPAQRRIAAPLVVSCLMISGLIAGFAYESLQTQIQLTLRA